MNKIVIHWTAGTTQPNNVDFQHYHYLINGDGLKVEGKYKPEDNENCNDGKYAAHTGGGNTGAIGVALCGMLGYVSKKNVGKYPIRQVQCEATFKLVAELCKKYRIAISPDTVMTHYEFGRKHPKTSSAGKIDITWLPYSEDEIKKVTKSNTVTADSYGAFIRNKVLWYFLKK